jgi:hypothetical protein
MTLVPAEKVGDAITCGSDPDQHVTQLRSYVEAGVDEVYVQQIGPDLDGSSPLPAGGAAAAPRVAPARPD